MQRGFAGVSAEIAMLRAAFGPGRYGAFLKTHASLEHVEAFRARESAFRDRLETVAPDGTDRL